MASCKYCGRDMLDSDSCTLLHEEINGKTYRRLSGYMNDAPDGERCRDCGILRVEGNAHHPVCDSEGCPACGGQAFCCDCSHGNMS